VEFSKALMEGVTSLVDCHQQSLTFADSTKSVDDTIIMYGTLRTQPLFSNVYLYT